MKQPISEEELARLVEEDVAKAQAEMDDLELIPFFEPDAPPITVREWIDEGATA